MLNMMPVSAQLAVVDIEELLGGKQFTGFKFSQLDDADRSPPESHTFRYDTSDILIQSDLDVLISPELAGTAAASDGEPGGPVFVAGGSAVQISWRGRDVHFVNAVAAQQPTLNITGFAIREDSPVDI